MIIKENEITVRPLTREDASFLLKWLTDPVVLEFYEGRDTYFTPELIEEHFYTEVIEEMRRCIVEYDCAPIGYIQIYPLNAELFEEYSYPDPGGLCFATDQFVGEHGLWGKGVGRKFLSAVLRQLTKEGAVSVVLDPHADNERAIRCYEACGFKKLKLLPAHELHEGKKCDCILMEYRP